MTHTYRNFRTLMKSCLSLTLLMIFMSSTYAQFDSCDIIACNDRVLLRVEKGESYPTTPEMFLEGYICANRTYSISYLDAGGNEHDFDEVHDSLPSEFTYIVEENRNGNQCWGTAELKVLDCDLPFDPKLRELKVEINCFDDISPESLGFPTPPGRNPEPHPDYPGQYIVKNWSPCGDALLTFADETLKFDCTEPVRAIIKRTWVVWDDGGLVKQSTDSIILRRASLDQIMELPNYDGIEGPVLDCSDDWNVLGTDMPSPEVTGTPLMHESCDLYAVNYHDIVFDVSKDSCFVEKKIIRTWTIIDWCLMETREFEQVILIECSKDDMAPIVICKTGLRVKLNARGTFDLYPSDIDAGSYDDCGIARLSFDSAGAVGVITFDRNDANKTHVVQMFATDHGGRQNSCWTEVEVLGGPGQIGNIGGKFYNYLLEPITFKESMRFSVNDGNLTSPVDQCDLPADPDDLGYAVCFDPTGFRAPYYISAEVEQNNPLEGLSTLDAVLLMKMLITRGDANPFLKIAADVNGDQAITATDVAYLRAVILAKRTLDVEPWQFWQADTNNLQRLAKLEINSLPFYEADIVPVRIGDLSNDHLTGGFSGRNVTRSGEEMVMYYHDKEVRQGEAFDIWVRTDDQRSVIAVQMAQYFDNRGVDVMDIGSNIPEASEYWAGYEDEWRYILVDPLLEALDLDQEWLRITFLARENGMASDFISHEEYPFDLLAVDEDLQEVPIKLEVRESTSNKDLEPGHSITIYPNPFSQEAVIDLGDLGEQKGIFKIYNTSGRLIFQTSLEDLSQSGQLVVDRNILKTNGLFIGVAETTTDRHVVKINKL